VHPRTYVTLTLVVSSVLIAEGRVRADEPIRPLLLGGDFPTEAREVHYDPLLPSGEPLLSRPEWPATSAGSGRFPVSVSGGTETERASALQLLETAYERLWLVAGRPLSGPASLVWRLDPEAPSATPTVETEPLPTLGFDRSSTLCSGGRLVPGSAHECALAALVGERSPGTSKAFLSGLSRASRVDFEGPDQEDADWLVRANEHPEAPILTRTPTGAASDQSALFFAFLGDYSHGSIAETGLLALGLAATQTPSGALRYRAEPDALDIVRHSLGSSREQTARFFSALTDSRYLNGAGHLFGGLVSEKASETVRIDASSLPRHLVFPRHFGPSGSLALRVDVNVDPLTVAFRIFCESPVSTVWSVLRLGPEGQLRGRVILPYQEVAQNLGRRVASDGASALLLVGTNLGGVDLDHPYDPDHGPHEPHTCSVAVDAISVEMAGSSAPR
jgi:hypothetical protein